MYEYKCEVTRVVDGDTIDVILDLGFKILHKARVRLFGIDTPESRTRDKDEKVRGKMASKFLQEAIDSGSVVTTEITIPQERPNRKRKNNDGEDENIRGRKGPD
jgi:micrococcal nuclease|tara:strand:+ start:1000 stop:1311 length:312 start_codon:yes stop_codon:yes gene_type:complete